MGAEGIEKLLKQVLQTAMTQKAFTKSDLKQITADTTVQEKAVAFPTDARLYAKARRALVRAAKELLTSSSPELDFKEHPLPISTVA